MSKEESVILKVAFQMAVGTGQGGGRECPMSLMLGREKEACCWKDHGRSTTTAGECLGQGAFPGVGNISAGLGGTPIGQQGQGPLKLANAQHRDATLLGRFRDELHQCWY